MLIRIATGGIPWTRGFAKGGGTSFHKGGGGTPMAGTTIH